MTFDKKVSSIISSLVYKKRRNPDDTKLLNQKREESRLEFERFSRFKKEYFENDSSVYPAYLFLEESVISSYGICPHLDINEPDFENKRKDWLLIQYDKGDVYLKLYSVYKNNKTQYQQDSLEKIEIIEEFIDINLTDSQKVLYKDCQIILEEYTTCKCKNKTVKEKFKLALHSLSIITNETGLHIYKWLEVKYSVILIINQTNTNSYNNDTFLNLISQFSSLQETNYKRERLIINKTNTLKEQLYQELNKTKRLGKYFKKWSSLSLEEQNDRILDYCNTSKYNTDKLYELLLKSDREQLNKLIRWNIKSGFVNQILNIKQNENGELSLEYKKSIKRISKKTILNKDNDKTINEELLYIICTRLDLNKETIDGVENSTSENEIRDEIQDEIQDDIQDDIIFRVKTKLKIKKLSNDDKSALLTRYKEMLNIIKEHQR